MKIYVFRLEAVLPLELPNGASADCIMIFGTEVNLRFLSTCDTWLVDGTFSFAPNRATTTYFRILESLKSNELILQPKFITRDFEKPSLNAFRSSFPAEKMLLSVYCKIQSFPEVLHQYSNDLEFAYEIRQSNALASIPPHDVHLVYDVLMDEPFFVADGMQTLLAEFTTYFELTWVGFTNESILAISKALETMRPILPCLLSRMICSRNKIGGSSSTQRQI
ncbi:hypothetical protein ILUMI_24005 [Ignelater luminosus]|uniref:Uncharacterized protein n=1 Tax=Ignelater luminosus TaxID=2038154 RepID=A0A8K0G1E5_IGNLU|nr:hypothetical protein ILUMI_24005 [Ignelater luminosus]